MMNLLFKSSVIGAGAVTSFGYRKDRNGQWLKKDALPPQDDRTHSPLLNEMIKPL